MLWRVAMIVLLPGCHLVFELPEFTCPDTYTLTINQMTSRYRLIDDDQRSYFASAVIYDESENSSRRP